MLDSRCAVEVGAHPGPFWVDKKSGLKVCSRHMHQYNERESDLGPFDWEKQHVMDFSAFIEED